MPTSVLLYFVVNCVVAYKRSYLVESSTSVCLETKFPVMNTSTKNSGYFLIGIAPTPVFIFNLPDSSYFPMS
jgi:hypothetical protein